MCWHRAIWMSRSCKHFSCHPRSFLSFCFFLVSLSLHPWMQWMSHNMKHTHALSVCVRDSARYVEESLSRDRCDLTSLVDCCTLNCIMLHTRSIYCDDDFLFSVFFVSRLRSLFLCFTASLLVSCHRVWLRGGDEGRKGGRGEEEATAAFSLICDSHVHLYALSAINQLKCTPVTPDHLVHARVSHSLSKCLMSNVQPLDRTVHCLASSS